MLRSDADARRRLAHLATRRVLVPHVARRVALDEVAQVQSAMARGHGRGKIVVPPQGTPPAGPPQ